LNKLAPHTVCKAENGSKGFIKLKNPELIGNAVVIAAVEIKKIR